MAAVSDKAEFYIEQTVPELQEWLRKEIFSKTEITQINSRRTRFEHLVNSREATPSIYARYASYEMNIDSLRRKRIKRLGVKMPLHTGQRRIYFILDRATKKFHGDLGLWMQYIEYARKCKANKKTEELLTKVLRMHPTKPELWIYAANWALEEEGDMKAARGYFQRGLRFCERAKDLWVGYARLEMIYVAKIAERRRILGLDAAGEAASTGSWADEDDGGIALDADTIALPTVTADDLDPDTSKQELVTDGDRDKFASNPILEGAIPIAIFDNAMKKFVQDDKLAMRFFNMLAEFDSVPSLRHILQHVLESLRSLKRQSVATVACSFKMPLVGVRVSSPDFPSSLSDSLQQMNAAITETPNLAPEFAIHAVQVLISLAVADELDEALQRVISASLKRYVKLTEATQLAEIVANLHDNRRNKEATALLNIARKYFSSSGELERLQEPTTKTLVAEADME